MSLISNSTIMILSQNIGPIMMSKKVLSKMYCTVREIVLSIHLIITSFRTNQDNLISVILRGSCLDSTTLSLLKQLEDECSNYKIFLGVGSVSKFSQTTRNIEHELEKMNIDINSVAIHSREFNHQLARSELLFYTSNDDIWLRRAVSSSELTIVHLYHGINVKARGNLSMPSMQRQRQKKFKRLPLFKYGLSGIFDAVDIKSVASDPELFYHSAGAARAPGVFRKYGYPQIDRSRELADTDASPILAESLKMKLRSDDSPFAILFAPTGDSEDPLEIISSDITEFLERHNAELYLRMHITKEEKKTELIKHNRIHHISRDQAPSSVEIFPYIDVLITDFSSIFIEYLPFNRPIIFDKTSHDTYQKQVGLSYDYDMYFPGKKANNNNELKVILEQCLAGTDDSSIDRQFVSKVLLAYENKFTTNLKNDEVIK